MKKTVLALAMMTTLIACGDKNANTNTTPTTDAHGSTTTQPAANTQPTTPAATDVKSLIVGSWTSNNGATMETYTFKADGTYEGYASGDDLKGTWAIEGDKFQWDKQTPEPFKLENNNALLTIGDRVLDRDGQ